MYVIFKSFVPVIYIWIEIWEIGIDCVSFLHWCGLLCKSLAKKRQWKTIFNLMFVHVPMIMPITCRSTTLQNKVDQFNKKYERIDRINTHFVYLIARYSLQHTMEFLCVRVWTETFILSLKYSCVAKRWIDLEFKWMINEPSCFIHIKMLVVWMMNGITIIIRLFQVLECFVVWCFHARATCLFILFNCGCHHLD